MKLLNLFAGRREKAEAPERNERTQKVQYAPLYAISSGRSERAQKAPYAPQVWSDVYKKSTRARKLQAEGAFSGRSMVEMLGVLAIVGVLSVGAIAGYGTAMYKYRMNKTIQAFTDFLQNLAELSTKNWGGEEIYSPNTEYVKYGLLPASMCQEDYVDVWGRTGYACKLPLGEIDMDFVNGGFLSGEFSIRFYEGDTVKSCVDFLSHGWWNIYPQEWLRTGDDIEGSRIYAWNENDAQVLWAVQPEYWSGAKKDITLSDIQNACNVCKGSAYCEIYMIINHEI